MCVLVASIKKRRYLQYNLYTILQIFSVTVFKKMSIAQALTDSGMTIPLDDLCNQLLLFEL